VIEPFNLAKSMKNNNSYFVLAYYHFTPIEDPQLEVSRHKAFFAGRDVTGRIYISEQGINGQMSGAVEDAQAYMVWMQKDSRFEQMEFKIHRHPEQAFPRMTVKYRKQLVAIDTDVDMSQKGEHVSPAEWLEMLNSGEDYLVLDVRNDYEWEIGHFEGATLPPCQTFREFPSYADQLKQEIDPATTKVMMYCTGGIRCELFSALLKQKGFQHVYQLHGGVVKYGLETQGEHWKGKLFVFDDRLAVPISNELKEPVGSCHHCHAPADIYYNCANMDCNELFTCCPDCFTRFKGCCQESCMHSVRLRPHQPQDAHKPFRKKHLCL